ncbi:MAG: SsrA-binding protein SmpB [Thermanaerothrix sp.]|nr:SsrA-binding protein SmpB [Thermanaerothrix sp.]
MEKDRIVAQNRKARFDYFILDTLEVGIVLTGTEIKSLREGRVNLKDGYAAVKDGELWLIGVHISPYEKGSYYNVDPERPRKLLASKVEILRLHQKVREKGLTLIPLRIYIKNNRWAKVELGLAKGKALHDKRDALAEKQAKREMERAVRSR